MSVADAVSNVLITLQHIKENLPLEVMQTAPLPVIASPQWWIDEVALVAAKDALSDEVPAGFEIHGCPVVLKSELDEPMMITHEGKCYPVLPQWQRDERAGVGRGDAAANDGGVVTVSEPRAVVVDWSAS